MIFVSLKIARENIQNVVGMSGSKDSSACEPRIGASPHVPNIRILGPSELGRFGETGPGRPCVGSS